MSKASRYYYAGIVSAAHLTHEEWINLDVGRYILSNSIIHFRSVLGSFRRLMDGFAYAHGVQAYRILDESAQDELPSLFIEIGTPVLRNAIAKNPDYTGSDRDRLLRGTLKSIVVKRVAEAFIKQHVPAEAFPSVCRHLRSNGFALEGTGNFLTTIADPDGDRTARAVEVACLSGDPISEFELDEDRQRVAYMLEMVRDRLTPMIYKTLRAHLVDGMPQVAIAEHFGVHPNCIYDYLKRGRQRLEAILAERSASQVAA